MELVLEKAKDFKKSIDAIAVLIDEAEFLLSEKGMELKATDPSQISLIDFKLEKKAFKKFSVEGDIAIGLDLDYLAQVMARAKPEDELLLSLDEQKTTLLVRFKGASTRSFSIPLIDVSKAQVPEPKIEFDISLELKAAVLQDALKDAELISTHITIGATEKEFFVKAKSSKGTLDSTTEKNSKDFKSFNVKGECRSMFPLDYLRDMLKAAPSDENVLVELGKDRPIRIAYHIGPAAITYFLAPRIESE